MVKLADIAEKAGVSIGVVSRILNNSQGNVRVSEKTRENVLKAAEVLNYVPDARGRTLKKADSPVIGVLINHLKSSIRSYMLEAISKAAWANGKETLIGVHEWETATALEQIDIFSMNRTAGVIIITAYRESDDAVFEKLVRNQEYCGPVVCFSLNRMRKDVNTVVLNIDAMCKDMADKFTAANYRKAFFWGFTDNSTKSVYPAFEKAMRKKSDLQPALINRTRKHTQREYIEYTAEKICKEAESKPVALFAMQDANLLALVDILKNRNISIPEQVGIISYGSDPAIADICNPGLVKFDLTNTFPQMADKAVQLISDRKKTLTKKVKTFSFKPEIIGSGSLAI
ncbi:MAG: LacI family DNA-binding transcriptional regulator [Planctomycetota bacterium]